jgi:hypothetical protein
MVALAVCDGELESATATTNEYVPAVVGVPEITPVLAERTSPVGSWPEARLHVYVGVPPAAARVATYGVPATLDGNTVVEIVTVAPPAAGAMTTGRACDSAMVSGSCTFN